MAEREKDNGKASERKTFWKQNFPNATRFYKARLRKPTLFWILASCVALLLFALISLCSVDDRVYDAAVNEQNGDIAFVLDSSGEILVTAYDFSGALRMEQAFDASYHHMKTAYVQYDGSCLKVLFSATGIVLVYDENYTLISTTTQEEVGVKKAKWDGWINRFGYKNDEFRFAVGDASWDDGTYRYFYDETMPWRARISGKPEVAFYRVGADGSKVEFWRLKS